MYNGMNPNPHVLITSNNRERNNHTNIQIIEDYKTNDWDIEILNYILEDDSENFYRYISQYDPKSINKIFNQRFFRLPKILSNNPTYAHLCAFFGAKKCLETLLISSNEENLKSDQFQQTDDMNRYLTHFLCCYCLDSRIDRYPLDIARKLYNDGYKFTEIDLDGFTPLYYAAYYGNIDIITFIFNKLPDLFFGEKSSISFDILQGSCQSGHINIIKFIQKIYERDDKRKKFLFSKRNKQKATLLHLACKMNQIKVLQYLLSTEFYLTKKLNFVDSTSRTPLIIACQNGYIDIVKFLYEKTEINFSKKKKLFPLLEASKHDHLNIVKYLLKLQETSVEQEDNKGRSALTMAILNQNIQIIQLLIDFNALKNLNTFKLGTLFKIACEVDNFTIIKMLSESFKVPYNVQFEQDQKWGDIFMNIAFNKQDHILVKFLLDEGCTFKYINLSKQVRRKHLEFIDFMVNYNSLDPKNTVKSDKLIFHAIETGDLRVVTKMLNYGFILNTEIVSQPGCIFAACEKLKIDLFNFLMTYNPKLSDYNQCLKKLILNYSREKMRMNEKRKNDCIYMIEKILQTQNVNLNEDIQNESKKIRLPVTLAANEGLIELLELFEKYGADFNKCPFEHSKMNKLLKVIDFLRSHGCKFKNLIEF